jgi:hypothetical protein
LGIFKNLPQHASIHPAFRLTLASFTENYLLGRSLTPKELGQ